jgi:PIN domain nuclease of toxin-antitoxin system
MKLLLDTHIWLWSLLEPRRLSKRVTEELRDDKNELWLSPISTWELMVLCSKGRVTLTLGVEEWIAQARRAAPLVDAPLTHDVALETLRIRLTHRDPADVFLAATARVYGLTLVTADERLLRTKNLAVLANR